MKSVAGQLCSGEDAGDDHLTVPRCLSSCLRTGVLWGQVSATRGAHQGPESGRELLRFDHHVAAVARQTSQRVSVLCRMAGNLDAHGILTLYKTQIRPRVEYGALTWMSSAATHMWRLDAVQKRALRLVITDEYQQPAHVTSLEYRRDVSALMVCHKAQMQRVSHLDGLRLPHRPVQRYTRTATTSYKLVKLPRSHSRQHQRTYSVRTAKLRNMSVAATPEVQNMSTNTTKV